MSRIIQAHGLQPVPVDLDPATLALRPGALESALTPRTRAVLVAHLFGGKMDLEYVSRFAREHDLLLIEDCAQAFQGPRNLTDTSSAVSMYSFGPLKTATALGGAILRVNDTTLLTKMRSIEESYSLQSRSEYALRLLKYFALVLVSRPIPYGLLVRACRLFRTELDALLSAAARSFPPEDGGQFLQRIRRRPSVALLSLLDRRLREFDYKRLNRRTLTGDRAARLLEPYVTLPGVRSLERTHWIFPVVTSCPDTLIRALRNHGFDASYATSNLVALEAPPGRSSPRAAAGMMSNVVFLPVYPELPEGYLELLAAAVARSTA